MILIVEDNEIMRSYIQSVLTPDFQLLLARDGEEELAMAQLHIPDLIVSDIMMPKMDGIAMVKELRNSEKTNHIPIIILTSLDKEEQSSKATLWVLRIISPNPSHAKILV